MKTILTKTITLLLFTSLMASFIAYQAGYFSGTRNSYQTSPNGGALPTNSTSENTDSIAWTKENIRLSSSKVMLDVAAPLAEEILKARLDSVILAKEDSLSALEKQATPKKNK